uniref:Reverse transcriptase Ty1/copia-type domain-containing protein n=1 Tax=Tanacetum cinerariifolium TaxID=118510 RepID=A0A6L2KHG7_TANCI|nr:hypothetical protein [Tanacetum cinerariifolium]
MSAVQTRSKVNKKSKAHALVSYIQKQQRNNHKDFQHCLFACFLSQIEPKKISQALEDKSWVDVMQEELLHFQIQKEGIDYDEVFAPVARIEAIRIFLAFASYIGFIVNQIDVKSAFMYGTIDEEVYLTQPPGFVDLKFPNKVYKVVKALYGLHQAPRAWYATLFTFLEKSGYRRGAIDKTLFIKQDKKDIMLVQVYVDDIIFGSTKKSWCDEFEELMKNRFQMSFMGKLTFFLGLQVKQKEDGIFISQDKYVAEILKKFDFLSVKTTSTPIETQNPLVKDEEAADVDVTPKTSHLQAVKRIFRKYTTRGCQFLGMRLMSCKELASPKQTTLGKDNSNSLIVDSLLKTIWLSMHHFIAMKHWLFQSKRLLGWKDDDNAATKEVNAAEPTVFDDEKYVDKKENIDWNVVVKQMQEKHLDNIRKYQSMTYEKVRPIFEKEYNKVQTLLKPDKDEEPTKKRVAKETPLQESFKKLKAIEVLGFESTQDTPTIDPKEMSEEDVKKMLKIVLVTEFKVEALQVKYPLIDWEIHYEGSRSYWKIIRVGGITEAYQSFEDMLKGFDREDLDALWRLVKEKFSTTVPTVDKEKALWVELTRLFKPNANDVFWKLQRCMHYPLLWKLHSNCGVYQVSSTTRRHDMFMLTEKDYPLSNGVMTLMLNTKLQVEEDSEMARDLVMKIFMKANQPKSKSLDTSSK